MTAKVANGSGRGSKPGERRGGRTAGTPNKKTAAQAEECAKTGETPLQFMLRIMRDENKEEGLRIDCAKAAAQYVHPKLSAIDATIDGKVTLGGLLDALDD